MQVKMQLVYFITPVEMDVREVLVQPEPLLRFPCVMNAVLAGRVDHPWAIRWRMKLFFWFARLNQHIPLVKRLNFD